MEGGGSRTQLLPDRVSRVEQGFLRRNRVQGERAMLFGEGTEHQKEEPVLQGAGL